jgi:protein-tyrosine kinase
MSRIQEILNKAQRDGTVRRTRPLADEYGPAPIEDAGRGGNVAEPMAPRPLPDRGPARPPIGGETYRTATIADFPGTTRGQDAAASAAALAPAAAPPYEEETAGAAWPPSAEAPARAVPHLSPLLVAALAPMSLAAEQYRSLRTRLKRAENGRALRAIAITSPSKGDGKSLTAANLALTMAQEFQERVLLIDADLRRPSVHRLFGIAEGPGLADVLMSAAELEEALVAVPDHHLTLLPAGAPPSHPAELLGSATMRRVTDTLRTRFDRILIDVPPVAPLADLHILTPLVDGVLMIVRAGVTSKPAIERALSGLDASKVLGLVLNEAGDTGQDGHRYEGYGYIAG